MYSLWFIIIIIIYKHRLFTKGKTNKGFENFEEMNSATKWQRATREKKRFRRTRRSGSKRKSFKDEESLMKIRNYSLSRTEAHESKTSFQMDSEENYSTTDTDSEPDRYESWMVAPGTLCPNEISTFNFDNFQRVLTPRVSYCLLGPIHSGEWRLLKNETYTRNQNLV